MITIIITSYGELKATERAVNSFLNQNISDDFRIIISDPFTETKWMIEEKFPDTKKIEYFEDEGKGKSSALNAILKKIYTENTEDIIISTDGDVYVSYIAVKEILNVFKDKKIGILCGHPVSLNEKNNMFGYWSHLSFDEMNRTRKHLFSRNEFFEVSGYLMAFRNGVIKDFPVEASEDSILPFLFWQKKYLIGYAEKAEVYVLNPKNIKDWITQKKRNIKGHIALKKLVDFSVAPKRRNTFFQEALRGVKISLAYNKSIKELYWNMLLFPARAYLHLVGFYESRIKKEEYKDGWRERETPTTRPLD